MKKHHNQKDDTQVVADTTDSTVEPKDVQSEAEMWKTQYMRALADYQNLERRNREDREEIRKYASELLLSRMIPAIDTLQKAKDHLRDVGLDLAFKEFTAILDEKGVVKMHTVGEQFDPHLMECIEVVDGEDNVVVEELLSGYILNDKVLRVAQVKVGKKQ